MVHLLPDMLIDVVALHEVKPTFLNIEAATTLTFPEWKICYHPHPLATIHAVAFLLRNTVDDFVLKDGNQSAFLFPRPMGPSLALLCSFPTSSDYKSSITMDS